MTLNYDYMRNRYENTKPIRGRAVDVRPIDKRRRDWEQIVERKIIEGEATYVAYAARLYDTDVVTYYHDGRIGLRIDGWATPSTAEFIYSWIPRGAHIFKKYNKLWINIRGSGTYLIPHNGELRIKKDGEYNITVLNPVQPKQKVVDRKAIKAVRDRIKPFTDFATAMLKMTEGLITKETRREYAYESTYHYWTEEHQYRLQDGTKLDYTFFHRLDTDIALSIIEKLDQSEYMVMMLAALRHFNGAYDKINQAQIQYTLPNNQGQPHTAYVYDHVYPVHAIKAVTDNIIKRMNGVHKLRDVEVGKCVTNVVA